MYDLTSRALNLPQTVTIFSVVRVTDPAIVSKNMRKSLVILILLTHCVWRSFVNWLLFLFMNGVPGEVEVTPHSSF